MILLAEEEATTIVEVGKELIFFTLIVVIENFSLLHLLITGCNS